MLVREASATSLCKLEPCTSCPSVRARSQDHCVLALDAHGGGGPEVRPVAQQPYRTLSPPASLQHATQHGACATLPLYHSAPATPSRLCDTRLHCVAARVGARRLQAGSSAQMIGALDLDVKLSSGHLLIAASGGLTT